MFGYNDMNTYTPNPFAVDEMINMSGAGKKFKGKKLNFIDNERRQTGKYISRVDEGYYVDGPKLGRPKRWNEPKGKKN